MGNQIGLTILIMIAIVCVLAFTEIIYRRFGLKGEITRKFAHFTATLATSTFPYLFNSHWYVLVLALFFFLVLFLSRHGSQLKSIHDIERKSVGGYMLPVAVWVTFFIAERYQSKIMFVLPMLILAVCDPMAGILGMNFKRNNKKIRIFGHELQKTWLGSGAFLVSAFIISAIALYFNTMDFSIKTFWLAMGIASTGTVVEMLSWRGMDNLFIPVSVAVMLILLM